MDIRSLVIVCIIGTVVSVAPVRSEATDKIDKAGLREALMSANRIEQPAKAASLVTEAPRSQKAEVAAFLATVVGNRNPASLPEVVSAIVSATPRSGTEIVRSVARRFPKRAEAIAVVASQAAPKSATEIVGTIAEKTPKMAPGVTKKVADAFPKERVLIVAAALKGLEKNAGLENTELETGRISMNMKPAWASSGGNSSDVPDAILSQLGEDYDEESELNFSSGASKGEKTSFAAQLLQAKKTQSLKALVNKLETDLAQTDLTASQIQQIVQAVESEGLEDGRKIAIDAKINYASP